MYQRTKMCRHLLPHGR